MKIKTWYIESLVVFFLLSFIAIYRGNLLHEWIAVFAVWFSFGHTSIAERMAERQKIKEKPDVECHRHLLHYFIAKEIFWVINFLILKSYASLLGCAIFLLYPIWRKLYRKYKPLKIKIILD